MRYIIFIFTICIFVGCTYTTNKIDHNIVMFNSEGKPISPKTRIVEGPVFRYDDHLESVMNELEKFTNSSNQKNIKLIVYVHGGLVSLDESTKNAEKIYEKIQKTNEKIFPIFVNWDANFFRSYGQDLFFVRQGEIYRVLGPITSPIYFLYDMGRSVAHLPISLFQQFKSDIKTTFLRDCFPSHKNATILLEQLLKESNSVHVAYGIEGNDTWDDIPKILAYPITLPTKILGAPIVNTGGTRTWNNLKRRTKALFYDPEDFDIQDHNYSDQVQQTLNSKHGGMYRFIRVLEKKITELKDQGFELEITLVGHSMGCIVLNEMVRRSKTLEIENIVYMGAACSIRDFNDSVVSYMESDYGNNTKFYNLCLHPISELGETYTVSGIPVDLLQRGSLLVWIDNLFEVSSDFLDRTLGQWLNIIQATHIFPSQIRNRVYIKAFAHGFYNVKDQQPQTHGSFDNMTFWKQEYWLKDKKTLKANK